MRIRELHRWDLTPREAVQAQERLRAHLVTRPLRGAVRSVAGGDIAYCKRTERLFAAVVVLQLPELETLEEVRVARGVAYPYIPGLLSFREAPALLEAFTRLRCAPDAVLVDGQGQAHPRGVGIAAHLGLLLDTPTVGCAKSRLCGEHDEPGPEAGDSAPLFLGGRRVGAVLRTRRGVRPLYVSPGHLCDIASSVRLVLDCGGGYRSPEPVRRAHTLVTRMRIEAGARDDSPPVPRRS